MLGNKHILKYLFDSEKSDFQTLKFLLYFGNYLAILKMLPIFFASLFGFEKLASLTYCPIEFYWVFMMIKSFRKSVESVWRWHARCLKITEKVSFKIASEASYVYILNGQKLLENAKIQMRQFRWFWTLWLINFWTNATFLFFFNNVFFVNRLEKALGNPDLRSWLTNLLRKSFPVLDFFWFTSLKKSFISLWIRPCIITTMKRFKFTDHSVFIRKLVKLALQKSTIVQVQEVSSSTQILDSRQWEIRNRKNLEHK